MHQFDEVVEEVERIVRAGRGFGVVLDAEGRVVAMAEAFEGLIVEIDVGEFDVGGLRESGSTAKPWLCEVISTLLVSLIQHRMVGAAMSEFELVGLAAAGQAHELVAEADAEDGRAADELADVRDLGFERLGIAGAVGEENSVGIEREYVFGGGEGGDDGDAASGVRRGGGGCCA